MRKFLTTPIPKGAGVVKCRIRRNKSGMNKLFPMYSLYLTDEDLFLLASRKRPNNMLSNYLITLSENDLSREGSGFLGKLRKKNMIGTEFIVYDDGHSPEDGYSGKNTRKELCAVTYAPNIIGSKGPRKMQVAVPSVDEDNNVSEANVDLLQRIKDRKFNDVTYMINKQPLWSEAVGAYVLNFYGRVTMASVKNFQLVCPEDQSTVLLQFGRTDKDSFNMDLRWPLSPMQAFAITLSSFDNKFGCD
mgnify:CR=1 FL=1